MTLAQFFSRKFTSFLLENIFVLFENIICSNSSFEFYFAQLPEIDIYVDTN